MVHSGIVLFLCGTVLVFSNGATLEPSPVEVKIRELPEDISQIAPFVFNGYPNYNIPSLISMPWNILNSAASEGKCKQSYIVKFIPCSSDTIKTEKSDISMAPLKLNWNQPLVLPSSEYTKYYERILKDIPEAPVLPPFDFDFKAFEINRENNAVILEAAKNKIELSQEDTDEKKLMFDSAKTEYIASTIDIKDIPEAPRLSSYQVPESRIPELSEKVIKFPCAAKKEHKEMKYVGEDQLLKKIETASMIPYLSYVQDIPEMPVLPQLPQQEIPTSDVEETKKSMQPIVVPEAPLLPTFESKFGERIISHKEYKTGEVPFVAWETPVNMYDWQEDSRDKIVDLKEKSTIPLEIPEAPRLSALDEFSFKFAKPVSTAEEKYEIKTAKPEPEIKQESMAAVHIQDIPEAPLLSSLDKSSFTFLKPDSEVKYEIETVSPEKESLPEFKEEIVAPVQIQDIPEAPQLSAFDESSFKFIKPVSTTELKYEVKPDISEKEYVPEKPSDMPFAFPALPYDYYWAKSTSDYLCKLNIKCEEPKVENYETEIKESIPPAPMLMPMDYPDVLRHTVFGSKVEDVISEAQKLKPVEINSPKISFAETAPELPHFKIEDFNFAPFYKTEISKSSIGKLQYPLHLVLPPGFDFSTEKCIKTLLDNFVVPNMMETYKEKYGVVVESPYMSQFRLPAL